MSLRDQVRSVLNRNNKTPKQLDDEHSDWIQTDAGLIDIIKQPILGIPPSKRTVDDNRELLINKIKAGNYGK